jgi:putative exosortase-associated protein (TIGR04073 family)
MQKRLIIVLFAVFFCLSAFLSVPAHADDPFRKLGRGVSNILMSWVEVSNGIQVGVRKDNKIAGVTHGIAHGTHRMIVRFLVGWHECFTFPFTGEEDYEAAYESEFVFDSLEKFE